MRPRPTPTDASEASEARAVTDPVTAPAGGAPGGVMRLWVGLAGGPRPRGEVLRVEPERALLWPNGADGVLGRPLTDLAPRAHRPAVARLLDTLETPAPDTPGERPDESRPLLLGDPGEAVLCVVSARVHEDGRRAVVEIGPTFPGRWESAGLQHVMSGLRGQSLWCYDEERDLFRWVENSLEYSAHRHSDGVPLAEVLAALHPEDVPGVENAFWALRRGDRDVVDIPFRHPDGRGGHRWLRSVSRIVRIGPAGTRRIVGSTSDHTDEVEHARSVAREHGRQSRLVRELAAAFVAAQTEEELTEAILHRVAPAFGGTGTLLAFVENDRLRVRFGDGIDPAMARSLHGMSLDAPKPLAHAIRTGRTEVIPSREDYRRAWPRAHGLLDATTARSFLMVPFAAEPGRPLGAWVLTYDEPHPTTEPERTLLDVIAELAGQAWERIRLSTSRLELAATIQRDMLPTALPATEGLEIAARYTPALEGLEVGGDWYDVIAFPDGRVACVIGDVQGHNVQAAALMGQVRTAVHAYAWQDPSPDRVLRRTNELMVQMGTSGFATCLYTLVEPDGTLWSARAGHVPPVLCGPGGTRAPETPGGLPLGVLADTSYPVTRDRLDPGGLLVLVTDGVVEGPELPVDDGLRTVSRTVWESRGAPVAELADLVMACARTTEHDDDRALLVIRRTTP
ncbi:SpoIIE family protein phosphatase (plasmid) [Streptomyces sp. BI20]|uniref:SpoIIE family protein phosphatase n=1 Tax=Streptomyces sp. BI20 TaxID=3403460 RepID=UPI003C72E101